MTATRIRALLRSFRLPTSQLAERLTKRNLFFVTALTLVVLIAVLLRLQPLNWGYTLSEFDPYFHYDVTEHIVANGFASWVDYRTDRAWYPWGRHVGRTSFPGLPMTSAALHLGLQLLGVQASVLDVCILFPVLFAALTCIVAFFLGREVGGDGVGLLAALFLAITPAYIGRTTLGFFDTETVGIFGILLVFLFYIRALKAEDRRWQLGYGAAGGLALGSSSRSSSSSLGGIVDGSSSPTSPWSPSPSSSRSRCRSSAGPSSASSRASRRSGSSSSSRCARSPSGSPRRGPASSSPPSA
jgi:4-amino-4-deoxy-L-arabinose transferase-like glycosyltransferase